MVRQPCFYLNLDDESYQPDDADTSTTYKCRHERHFQTNLEACAACRDHEPRLIRGTVKSWAVGLVVSPEDSIDQWREIVRGSSKNHWETILLFVHANQETEALNVTTVQRPQPLDSWGHWFLSLVELMLVAPQADAYFVVQKPIGVREASRSTLETILWPEEVVGAVALVGNSRANDDIRAHIFPNTSARSLIRNVDLVSRQTRGPEEGRETIAAAVRGWCEDVDLPYHTASLL